MSNHHFKVTRAVFAVALFATSCGSASFQSGGGGPKDAPATPDQPKGKMTSLTWFFECASAPGSAPPTKAGDVVIKGEGSHEFTKDQMGEGIPVTVGGHVCPPAKYPRDIVFVIDVSGSMIQSDKGNDPLVNNSCGRMQAVEAIISNIAAQGGDSRFGIVTFSDRLVGTPATQSTAMFADKENLYANIAPGRSAASVLCAAGGGTYYNHGLEGAQSLLNQSRDGALKEIYFVSDGAPSDGPASLLTASNLKSVGIDLKGEKYPVQIATVMMGSAADAELKAVASIDKAGASLHERSTDASKLAATLSSLASNEIDDGVIRYRATGTDLWTEIALRPNMKGFDFTIPSFQLSGDTAPNGLDLVFEYRDMHNNKYSSEGNIVWSAEKK